MSFEKDIQEIFQEILNQHGGNKAAAADSLGVNAVTMRSKQTRYVYLSVLHYSWVRKRYNVY